MSTSPHLPGAPPAPDGRRRRWPLLVIGASAGTAVWSGWVGLGQLVGFGIVHPLPGIWDTATLNTAITLPVGVEAYAMFALSVATGSTPITRTARRFAWTSSVASLALGMVGQVAYHLMNANHVTAAPWPIVAGVSCLPVLVLGVASVLWHLARQHPGTDTTRVGESGEATSSAEIEGAVRPAATAVAPGRTASDDATPAGGAAPASVPSAPANSPGTRRGRRSQTGRPDTAARVARVRAAHPDWSSSQVAQRLGVSERTVRRYTPVTGPGPVDVPADQDAA